MSNTRILITGASGLLGNNLARLAIDRGFIVTTLSRGSASQPALAFPANGARHLSVDLASPSFGEVMKAEVFDCIIHAAALIHVGWKKREESIRTNREGTKQLLEWARHRSTRVIHVSTVNCLPVSIDGKPIDETGKGGEQIPSTYVVSKQAAQQVCNESIERGDDCYSVYPGFMLGPYDWQMSSGRMVKALQSFRPWAPAGGCSVCDPRDVAQAILGLASHGAPHRHYILAGENMTYFAIWTELARRLGARPPVLAMRKPAKVIGSLMADLLNLFLTNESDFNSAAIAMSQQFHYYDSSLAHRELGYVSRPYSESIDDSIAWLSEMGYIKPKRIALTSG